MNVTLIQTELVWENAVQNRMHLERLIDSHHTKTDLFVLPEMFSTGFSMNPQQLAETMQGETMTWLKDMAQRKQTNICGSIMMNEEGRYVNRFVWMKPDGTFFFYDKRHLFRMGNEHLHYHSGQRRIIIEYNGWRIFPVVCYDLRFPVWLRRTKQFDYDMMLVVANWPEKRSEHWKALLTARAIENQCYVVAVNRTGEDGNAISHSGDSSIIRPKGEWLFRANAEETVTSFDLELEEVSGFRTLFPAMEDADNFVITDQVN